MATPTFREFIHDQLSEYEQHLKGINNTSVGNMEERLRGARDFAKFLFGEPFDKQ